MFVPMLTFADTCSAASAASPSHAALSLLLLPSASFCSLFCLSFEFAGPCRRWDPRTLAPTPWPSTSRATGSAAGKARGEDATLAGGGTMAALRPWAGGSLGVRGVCSSQPRSRVCGSSFLKGLNFLKVLEYTPGSLLGSHVHAFVREASGLADSSTQMKPKSIKLLSPPPPPPRGNPLHAPPLRCSKLPISLSLP